jgi:hypothetical protein
VLANEIDDAPETIALLDMCQRERRHFGSSQAAAEKYGKNRPIAQALQRVVSGALRRACACRRDSQFPVRMPCVFALLTRLMPAANSGTSSPLSAASAASLRIADILIMMDEDPRPRASSVTRQANGGLGEAGPRGLLEPTEELI